MLYDSTLRDGNQAVEVNFSVEDKVKLTRKLSELGVQMVEGGWPNPTNPAETEYFERMRGESVRAIVTAFGMTRRPGLQPEKDEMLQVLASVPASHIAVFGKTWLLHVEKVLGTTAEENLRMVEDTVSYLRGRGKNVIYDAEHFFDGFKDSREYALETLRAAERAGAEWIVLCDTRGGSTPFEVYEATLAAADEVKKPLGMHAHNDMGLGVANSVAAVEAGARMVQGTVNGIGERCGNADLIQVIGVLELKMGVKTGFELSRLTELSDYVYELTTLDENPRQPFVGRYVFSHKGGVHGHAVLKATEAYEFVDPSLVGNTRSVIVSSQAGTASVAGKARVFGYSLQRSDPRTAAILRRVKEMEAQGYVYENAEASLHLLYASVLLEPLRFFEIDHWTTIVVDRGGQQVCESVVKLKVGDREIISSAEGNGPVNAFDNALRKALLDTYPQIAPVRLAGYRVRELDTEKGTAAKVRVTVEFKGNGRTWSTVGVSANILNASEEALVDGYTYFLYTSSREPSSS